MELKFNKYYKENYLGANYLLKTNSNQDRLLHSRCDRFEAFVSILEN